MYKYISVCCLCYIFLLIFIFNDCGIVIGTSTHHLQRRYLSLRNTSNFFLRFNFKANMVPWTQIFAQAIGFRMNWKQLPDSLHPGRPQNMQRRDLYSHMETLLDKNGLNGFHCVRRAICEMNTIGVPQKIYHKLLKMIFRQQSSSTDKWHNTTDEDCDISLESCPFSFLDVSLYTDNL